MCNALLPAQPTNIVIRRAGPSVFDAPHFLNHRVRCHNLSCPQHYVCGEHTLPAARGKSFPTQSQIADGRWQKWSRRMQFPLNRAIQVLPRQAWGPVETTRGYRNPRGRLGRSRQAERVGHRVQPAFLNFSMGSAPRVSASFASRAGDSARASSCRARSRRSPIPSRMASSA